MTAYYYCPKCREPLPAGTPACEVDSVTYCEDHAKTTTLFDHVTWRDQAAVHDEPAQVDVRCSAGTEFEQAWYCRPPPPGSDYRVLDEDWDDGPPLRRNVYRWERA